MPNDTHICCCPRWRPFTCKFRRNCRQPPGPPSNWGDCSMIPGRVGNSPDSKYDSEIWTRSSQPLGLRRFRLRGPKSPFERPETGLGKGVLQVLVTRGFLGSDTPVNRVKVRLAEHSKQDFRILLLRCLAPLLDYWMRSVGRAGPHDLVLALAHLYVSKSPTGCLRPSTRPQGSFANLTKQVYSKPRHGRVIAGSSYFNLFTPDPLRGVTIGKLPVINPVINRLMAT